jgi:hypothetical protein
MFGFSCRQKAIVRREGTTLNGVNTSPARSTKGKEQMKKSSPVSALAGLITTFTSRALLLAASLPLVANAQVPESVLPNGVGVNIHFTTGHERDIDLIADAGFKFIRMDFHWTGIEREKGFYDWSAYDELTANLGKRGLRALYILDYSNPLYEEVVVSPHPIGGKPWKTAASPRHPESTAAFAKWAAAGARHFGGRKIIWEIWNEPNGHFWSPKPDAQQYAALALAPARAIHEVDPTATVVGPANSIFLWEFLEMLFKAGVLEHFAAVTVHPYRNKARPPETADADYARLREMIDRYAPPSRKGKISILSGELRRKIGDQRLELQALFEFRTRVHASGSQRIIRRTRQGEYGTSENVCSVRRTGPEVLDATQLRLNGTRDDRGNGEVRRPCMALCESLPVCRDAFRRAPARRENLACGQYRGCGATPLWSTHPQPVSSSPVELLLPRPC